MINFSPFIVGTMRLGQWGAKMNIDQYEKFIHQALDLGLRDFDHADIYGDYTTEDEFGQVLKRNSGLRKKMQITTKCGIRMVSPERPAHRVKHYDFSEKHIVASVENSLDKLGTDYLDLLLLHRPDYLIEAEEVAFCFEKLKKSGKVLHVGISNFSRVQAEFLSEYTDLDSHQLEFSLMQPEALDSGNFELCRLEDMKATAWSPLGGGLLLDDSSSSLQKGRIMAVCNRLKDKYDCSIDQLLLAWILRHPIGITPVLGSSKILRIASAMDALSIELSREDWYDLLAASRGKVVA